MHGDVSGGSFPLTGDLTLTRMGFGAMQLAGPGVWGPPLDRGAAIRVLRRVAELGLTHIDTAGFYGPDIVNDLIREALHPYPESLHIVTKVGYRRTRDRSWRPALSRQDLIASVHGNLWHLGLEAMDVVNLRVGDPEGRPAPGSVAEPFGVLAELQSQGLIRYLGLSNVTLDSWPRRGRWRASSASRIGTTWLTGRMTRCSTSVRPTASPSSRSSHCAVSPRRRRPRWTRSRRGWAPPPSRSRWPGCCTAPRTSC